LNQDQLKASDAQALLNNPAFKGAMKAMNDKLHSNIASGDPDNKEQCSRLVVAVQILKGIEREIERFVANGEVADLKEVQASKKLSVVERVSGKMVR